MDEQTELETELKVRLGVDTDARRQLRRQTEIMLSDGPKGHEDYAKRAAAVRAVGTDRQKTNIVLRTREEIESLFTLATFANPKSRNAKKALDRALGDVRTELRRRGYELDKSDKYDPELTREFVPGNPPEDIPYSEGDVIEAPATAAGHPSDSIHDVDTSGSLKDYTVDVVSKHRVFAEDVFGNYGWIPHTVVEGLNTERMRARRIAAEARAKREQADMDALLALCKRHAEHVANDVWPEDAVPVSEIDFEWNSQFSWLGGRYTPNDMRGGSIIELSPGLYYTHGLAELLEIVRHELIHAWQDYHPAGNPPDTHKHHGRDFRQWLDDMNTSRHCKTY